MHSDELTEKILSAASARAGDTYGFTITNDYLRRAVMTFLEMRRKGHSHSDSYKYMFSDMHIAYGAEQKAYKTAMGSVFRAVGMARRQQVPIPDNYDPRNPTITWADTYKVRPKEIARKVRRRIIRECASRIKAQKKTGANPIVAPIEFTQDSTGQIAFIL